MHKPKQLMCLNVSARVEEAHGWGSCRASLSAGKGLESHLREEEPLGGVDTAVGQLQNIVCEKMFCKWRMVRTNARLWEISTTLAVYPLLHLSAPYCTRHDTHLYSQRRLTRPWVFGA